ncbi:DUF4352 domain-containing protein [Actinoplanes sp. NPDC049596]|uniref:DUF4352 domain-containing protein n=1 Tax=unclassified Actinoplanes TaxID=2626549 RepID=UPI0034254EEA
MTAPALAPAKSRWPRILGLVIAFALLAAAGLLGFDKWRNRDGGEVLVTSGGQLGAAVKDGKFVFTVTAVRCRVAKVSDGSVDVEPKGSFCLADVIVRNASSRAAPFDSAAQVAYDDKGAEFATDMQAGVVVNPDRNFIYPINPGSQARGTLIFDVPKGGTLTSLVLHESFDTGGAKIAVS